VPRRLSRARRWGWLVFGLSGLLAAQCTQGSPTADGTITGVASPCIGAITSAGYHRLSVTVYLTKGAREEHPRLQVRYAPWGLRRCHSRRWRLQTGSRNSALWPDHQDQHPKLLPVGPLESASVYRLRRQPRVTL
jgi:hypothetical protein